MSNVTVHLPEGMESYAPDLEYFFNTMVRKLAMNKHKGEGVGLDIVLMVEGALTETKECFEAIQRGDQFGFVVECADVANYAFLAARNAFGMDRGAFNRKGMK